MWANNEIGTVLPVRELADVAAEFDIPLHADAVQAFGQSRSTSPPPASPR